MRDSAYQDLPRDLVTLDHEYGDRVHILADVAALSMLSRIGHPDSRQPAINRLLGRCYERLFLAAVNRLFPRIDGEVPTRMVATTPGAAYRGDLIDPQTRVVLVGLARAGTLPAYQGFELLHDLCAPEGLRVDHVNMQRRTDEQGRVVGVDVSGTKTGGGVDGAFVLLPDPMGATGSSMCDALALVESLPGTPQAVVGLHLIVTPEYIRKVHAEHPDTHIFALRLDRGTSSAEALAAVPGSHPNEAGTNEVQYIVPGAGGVGELINNSWA